MTTFAAFLLAPGAAWAACPDEDLRVRGDADLPRYERAIVCLVNEERVERDRAPLGLDARLARAAVRHTRDMVARRYFAHESPGGSTPPDRLRRAGYGARRRTWRFGEILAWGTGAAGRPAAIVRGWMASAGHRQAILDPRFTELGAGTASGSPRRPDAGVTVAVEFGG